MGVGWSTSSWGHQLLGVLFVSGLFTVAVNAGGVSPVLGSCVALLL